MKTLSIVRIVLIVQLVSLGLFQSDVEAQEKPDSTLRPASPLEAVVVSATRSEQAVGNLPTPVRVVGTAAIASTPAGTVPDLLRSVPGFSTRDYQSGYVAGPSQSIVTFRGLGGSSAGRALVLLDGVPLGDPFSGWLDWARIPLPMLASAEVIRGGGSMIWGSRALAGVVNLRTIVPRDNEARLHIEAGSFDTWHGAGTLNARQGKISALLAADYTDTKGFILVPEHQVGPIDRPQAMVSHVVTGRVTYDATPEVQGWLSASTFAAEEPPVSKGDAQEFHDVKAGFRWASQSRGVATVSAFANRRLSQTKSFTINSDRSTATPQRFGRSPARSTGVSAQWTQLYRNVHEITTGADFTTARGSLAEIYSFADGEATQERQAGGRQQLAGLFIQDAVDLGSRIRLVASARADHVQSTDGRRTVRALLDGNAISDSTIEDHSDVSLTWSAGLRRQQSPWLGLRVNAYESFRAPSMYEMYHPRFSARGTVTEANSELEAERLRGVEIGADISVGRNSLARITAFTNRVASPIMDITVATAGTQAEVIAPCGLMPSGQTCSQRRNVRSLRSNGLEADLSWNPSKTWRFEGGYSYSNTRVSAPGQPIDELQALRSAPHAAVASVSFDRPRWISASVEGRYVSSRFEDDLNSIKLDEFYLVGLRFNRAFGSRVTAHLKLENLLDEEYEVSRARSGLAEIGPGRWITAGLRTTW